MTKSRLSVSRETIPKARRLRREATPFERLVWSKIRLRQLGFVFRRRHPVGPYILDFYCPELKLCIEIDGDSHGVDGASAGDARRTAFLERKGITVIRFRNSGVRGDLMGAADRILEICQAIASDDAGVERFT